MKYQESPRLSIRLLSLMLLMGGLLIGALAQGQPFWPQFRGPTGQGISESAHPPVSFSKTNALWATEVPPGHSSPVVWGNKIFLTTQDRMSLQCRAYDRTKGERLWAKTVPAGKLEPMHPFNNAAAPSAAADGERVIFYFGSFGLLAYTHEGAPLWEKKLPMQVSRNKYGSASSPILCGDLVVLALDSDEGGSRLLALKRASGEVAWETERPLFSAGWSTPVVWTKEGHSEILLLGSKKLAAYEPGDGKELWSVAGFTLETVPSPACDAERVYACAAGMGGRSSLHFESSFWDQLQKVEANHDGKIQIEEVPQAFHLVQRPELPEGHSGRLLPFDVRGILKEVDQDKDGAVTEQEWTKGTEEFEKADAPVLMALLPGSVPKNQERVAWKYGRGIPEIPSPLAYEGKLYLIRDGGRLQCMDSATGAVLFQERIGAAGGYAASPVAAQGRVYVASQSGIVTVINARAPKLEVLARNPLEEKVTATPALVEGRIYVRTEKHLFAFGE